MASGGSGAATQRVAELEEELRGLAEQLSRCQADKEFVLFLWKHLEVSKPDLTQAVSLVVEREKQKAEVKDRSILEVLQAKDSKIESLEQRLTGQQQEINSLMQRKSAVDEENARLKNEFGNLNWKFKDKSQELKDTEERAQKKEEQNRLVIKNLEEENKGLNICCADLLSDLEKLRKREAQWKKEKCGNDTRIKNLETDLAETREQIKSLRSICSNLSSQVDVKQEELFQKDCDVVGAKKKLEELQNLYTNIEDRTQQAELIKQLEALSADIQKVLQDHEYVHTAKTTYQKIFQQPSLSELEDCITVQESEMELLQKKLKEGDPNLAEHNLYTADTLESNNIRTGKKHEQRLSSNYLAAVKPRSSVLSPQTFSLITKKKPPVKRSRSLSPKSSFRESEELKKLKIAERKIESLEKTLQLKSQESYELRAAYGKHEERLQMLQTNYRALKEQLKQWEEGNSSFENTKSRYQHTSSCQLCQEDCDVMWNELAFFKRESKKLLIEKLNLKKELDQMKIHHSVKPLFLSEDNGFKGNTPKRYMREVSHKMLQNVQQLERRIEAIEEELKKQINKDLLNKVYLKESLKVQKKDADTRKGELETLLKRICEVKKEKAELQFMIDEKEKEAASLKRQVTEANRLRNESEDLLSQVQEQKCLLDKAKAVAISGCNCKITGTKVKLKTAKKKSSLGHHGAFLKQSIKVMSNVFENFSKDGWEDVSESSDSEIATSESLETVIRKTVQNTDPLPDRSKQEEKKPCNVLNLEVQNEQYYKKEKDLKTWFMSVKESIAQMALALAVGNTSLTEFFNPSKVFKYPTVSRAKGRNITVQKPGNSVTLLQEKIKPLQKVVAVVQRKKKTMVTSIKNVKQTDEKLTSQLYLADQRLQVNKLTIEILTSNMAKWQQEKEDLQGKLKLREHLSQTADKSEAAPAPSKNIDLEMKQLQCKLKNSNAEIAKQSTTIKSLKKTSPGQRRMDSGAASEARRLFSPLCLVPPSVSCEIAAAPAAPRSLGERRVLFAAASTSELERDFTMKRHFIEDLKSCLKANQENEKISNILESLERKVKALADDKKASIDAMKQRFNVAMKETSRYEQMYHKAKDDLEKKDLKTTKLQRKVIEIEYAMTELESAASQQLHGLTKQSTQALETIQKELLLTSDKVEEFKTFVKTLARELHHSVQLRTKIKLAKKVGEMKACKKCLFQESIQLVSILNVSITDLYEILQEGDDEETAEMKMEFEKNKKWLQRIQKLLEAQFPFASYLMDAVLEKLNEKKKLVEEYSSLMNCMILLRFIFAKCD
ncbi:LOW QUALITY PROTEIN: centlein [Ammospiza maritima maritima]